MEKEAVGQVKKPETPDLSYYDALVKAGRWPKITPTAGETLYRKLEIEYQIFIEECEQLPAADIIDKAAEIAWKADMLILFEDGDFANKMVSVSPCITLDELYSEWLKRDPRYLNSLQDDILDIATDEIELEL